ncbi:MAG: DmsE family decaheme c-type cytochrome [Methylotenera sp.]|nr:DmsE family decaheme c-type cytochrome [Methylotenera sp.]
MKSIKKMMALGLLIGGLWSTTGLLAAGLPNLGESTPAQGKLSAYAAASQNKDAVCTKCHDESEVKPILAIYQTKHGVKGDPRTPSCQSCHGESDAHVKNAEGKSTRPAPEILFGTKRGSSGTFAPNEAKVQNASCLTCHDKDSKRTHWDGGAHNVNDVACASCHVTHSKHDNVRDKKTQPEVCFACHKEQRAQSRKMSHHPIGEGKVACSDCHNPHGSAGPKLLKKNTVNETCFTCHAEKRGPFLWEHQPVTEDCATCHTPHGSNISPLLKSRPPFLCSECHDGPHNSKVPAAGSAAGKQAGLTAAPSENYTGRACLNCHSMVHGSNHPAGALLHR